MSEMESLERVESMERGESLERGESMEPGESMEHVDGDALHGTEIAVVGMAGRFPGAETLDELGAMIAEGREGITTFTDEELRAAGTPEAWLSDPSFVK